jgi:hypothetical protein
MAIREYNKMQTSSKSKRYKERKKNKTMVIRELKLGSDLPSITGVDIYK